MKYGIIDTIDRPRLVWIGNKNGPWTTEDRDVARMQLTILTEQFGGKLGRFRLLEYVEGPVTQVENITAPITGLEALKQIEGRIKSK